MKTFLSLFLASVVLLLLVGPSTSASSNDAPRMAKEQLKPLLGNPDVIVLDARSSADYNSSDEKIKGGVRVEPGNVKTIVEKYPKDKTIVLY